MCSDYTEGWKEDIILDFLVFPGNTVLNKDPMPVENQKIATQGHCTCGIVILIWPV